MKTLIKSNKKKTLISILLFQIGLFSTYSQNFSLGDFTFPREITSINNMTNGSNILNMIAFGNFNADGKNKLKTRHRKFIKKQ